MPLNEPSRLYCEAFVGKVKLPDSKSFISWYRIYEDHTEQKLTNEQEIIKREDDQLVGALLTINETKPPYYGQYLCRIEIGNEAHRLDMRVQLKMPTYDYPFDPYTPALMAVMAVIFIIALLFLVKYSTVCIAIQQRSEKKFPPMNKQAMRIREVV